MSISCSILISINDSLENDHRFKHYDHISRIGLILTDIENLATIVKKMGNYFPCILEMVVINSEINHYFNAGVIPIAEGGILRITVLGRVNVQFITDSNKLYTKVTHNFTSEMDSYSKWREYIFKEIE